MVVTRHTEQKFCNNPPHVHISCQTFFTMPYIRSRTLQTSLNVIRLSSWTNRRTFSIFSLVRIENGRHEHTKSFKEALPLLKRKHHSNICVPPIMRGFTRMFINLRKYLITVKTKQCKFSDPDSLPFHWTTTIA